jgi:NhaP-type Na+/H+ or K+/H+ antiporter
MQVGYNALLFIVAAVFIGAAARHFLKNLKLPFTVILFIVGILLGVIKRVGFFEMELPLKLNFVSDSLSWAANIDPRLLLFVFLPILIFEASFNTDLFALKRSAVNSLILSVPGTIVAMLLTGVMVYAMDYLDIGLQGWANWYIAFMFGAIISSIDPVAVVAMLRDLGTGRKLSSLIGGEALLNDGSTYVFFIIFFHAIKGDSHHSGFYEFFRISVGGIALGLVVAGIVMRWLKDVINDSLVEISIVVAAAYGTFYVAEHFFHISGIMALLSFGLMMGSIGRTSISPRVYGFMHEFWNLAGFIANSMIFIIAGLVIAMRTNFTAADFISLFIVYVGLHAIRAIMIAMHFPVMKNAGYGLTKKGAIVLWYGGIRGAISLSLALIVTGIDDRFLSHSVKDQFMFLVAGTVTLTLLINAATIGFVIKKLGLAHLSPAKRLMNFHAHLYLRQSSEVELAKIKNDEDFRNADWLVVRRYLPEENFEVDTDPEEVDMGYETRRKLLEKEKRSYWHQFNEGLLGREAVRMLSDSINEVLDDKKLTSLAGREYLEQTWWPEPYYEKLMNFPLIKYWARKRLTAKLISSHDSAIGFIEAQDDTLRFVEKLRHLETDNINLELIASEINMNKQHGQNFIAALQLKYPNIYKKISTRHAIRKMLHYERKSIEKLVRNGRIDDDEAERMHRKLDMKMKQFGDSALDELE